jgi:hypothetical protein
MISMANGSSRNVIAVPLQSKAARGLGVGVSVLAPLPVPTPIIARMVCRRGCGRGDRLVRSCEQSSLPHSHHARFILGILTGPTLSDVVGSLVRVLLGSRVPVRCDCFTTS